MNGNILKFGHLIGSRVRNSRLPKPLRILVIRELFDRGSILKDIQIKSKGLLRVESYREG
jgi:hypothetical protein